MADTNTIIQKITIEGGKEIEAALKSMGKTGEDAFKKINNAANDVKGTASVENLGKSTTAAGETAAEAAGKFGRLRNILDFLGSTSKEAGRDAKGLGTGAASAIQGVKGLGDASDQAGAAVGATDVAVIRLAQTGRLLGRALRIPELSQFSRALGILGRAFTIAAPALFVASLEKMAASAAKAADTVADLAAKNKVSLDEFQDFAGAFIGIGGSVEDAGKAFTAFTSIIKETATNTDRNAKEFTKLQEQIASARDKSDELSQGFTKINLEATRAFRDIRVEQSALSRQFTNDEADFVQSLAKIQQQREDIENGGSVSASTQRQRKLDELAAQEQKLKDQRIEKQRKASEDALKLQEKEADAIKKQKDETKKLIDEQVAEDKKLRDLQKAFTDARIEAERNATVLEKLGIRALHSNGKLKKTPEALKDVADALKNLNDEEKRSKLENELVAAGLDRHLIPTYRKGSEAVAELSRRGKQIRPVFDKDKDVAVADDFLIKIGQVGTAIGTLKNILGLAAAPAFTAFFDRLIDIFISLQPAIREFGVLIGNFLKPLLEGFAGALSVLVDGLGGLFNGFASVVNGIFKINLTTVEVFAGIIAALAGYFLRLPVAIGLAIAALGKFFDFIKDQFGLSDFAITALKSLAVLTLGFVVFRSKVIGLLLGIPLVFARVMGLLRVLAVAGWLAIQTVFFGGISGIVASFGALFTSIGAFIPVLAIVAAAAAAFFLVWQNWDFVKKEAESAFNFISEKAKAIWPDIQAAFNTGIEILTGPFNVLLEVAKIAFEGLAILFKEIVIPAFNFLIFVLDKIAKFLNETFGTNITGVQLFVGAIGILAVALAGLPGIIAGVVVAVGLIIKGFEKNSLVLSILGVTILAVIGFFAFLPTVIALVVAAVAGIILKWEDLKKVGEKVADALRQKWDEFVKWLSGSWLGTLATVIGKAIDLFKALFAAKQEAGAVEDKLSGVGGVTELAGGGPVWGRGTSTSDSIPALLSNGEFVTKTRAVNYYGRNFMNALNQMRIPKEFLRGFNLGGLAERMATLVPGPLQLANGGSVQAPRSLHPVHLHLANGQVISGLQASDNVVKAISRASTSRQIASAGRKPSYYGRGK